jgi:Uma2 family endonuclease
MSATTVQRSFAEQHALNRQVWERLVDDPTLNDVLEKIETDRDGDLLMSPPPKKPHARRANRIAQLLNQLLKPTGGAQVDETVSTLEGVKVPDVAWYSAARAEASDADEDDLLSVVAPDVCVEVLSPGNTVREIRKKTAAYFAMGVREVWVCNLKGEMTFYGPQGPLEGSTICPEFPRQIPAKIIVR